MHNAHEWIDMIIGRLFEPDTKRVGKIMTELNSANSRLGNNTYFGFMHHGKKYLDPQFESQRKTLMTYPMPTLALELQGKAAQFNLELKQLEDDKARVKQAIAPLMINCQDLQDIRDSLPECLIHIVPQVQHLIRTKEDNTVFIRSDKFALRAYEKALPLIQAYSVAALIC